MTSRRTPLRIAGSTAAALALVAGASAASAAPGNATATPVTPSMSAQPRVTGPIADTPGHYMYSTMAKARTPLDLAAAGFVEEEYFLSGEASLYTETDTYGVADVVREGLDYTNNVIVRRPADAADASGVVVVDILNASNGYPGEDHWRRMWDWCLETGCTYVGMTSKPIQVDALKNFDPERYAPLSWDLPEGPEHAPIRYVEGQPFDPHQSIPGTEEGLVWDITTQLGVLLEENPSAIIGDVEPTTTILAGQSQSGIYLNTYAAHFDEAVRAANNGDVWDAYLNTVGGRNARALRQTATVGGGLASQPRPDAELGVPMITIDSEADVGLFGPASLTAEVPQPLRRHWQVPGSPHTFSASPVIPANEELLKAGRQPRPELTPEYLHAQNPYPLEATVVAALEALTSWHEDGTPAAPSAYFEFGSSGELVRDSLGNTVGGVRYALNRLPLARIIGFTKPGDMNGAVDVLSQAEFARVYGDRAGYLSRFDAAQAQDVAAGYLTGFGARQARGVANELIDRILAGEGDASEGRIPLEAVIPGVGDGGTGEPGSLVLSVRPGTLTLGGATNAGDRVRLTGELPEVSVTDSRGAGAGWSVTGRGSALTGGGADGGTGGGAGGSEISAAHVGWTPAVVEADGGGVAAGPTRAPALDGGAGLASPATLASAAGDGGRGTSRLGAQVRLDAPVATQAGTYTGSVTLTLFPQD